MPNNQYQHTWEDTEVALLVCKQELVDLNMDQKNLDQERLTMVRQTALGIHYCRIQLNIIESRKQKQLRDDGYRQCTCDEMWNHKVITTPGSLTWFRASDRALYIPAFANLPLSIMTGYTPEFEDSLPEFKLPDLRNQFPKI